MNARAVTMVKSGPAVANALFVDAKNKYIITETFTYKEDPNEIEITK
jgi:hypothetical protein